MWPGLGLGRLLNHIESTTTARSPSEQRTENSINPYISTCSQGKYPTLESLRSFDGEQPCGVPKMPSRHPSEQIHQRPRSPYASSVSMESWIYAGGLWSRAIAHAGPSARLPIWRTYLIHHTCIIDLATCKESQQTPSILAPLAEKKSDSQPSTTSASSPKVLHFLGSL